MSGRPHFTLATGVLAGALLLGACSPSVGPSTTAAGSLPGESDIPPTTLPIGGPESPATTQAAEPVVLTLVTVGSGFDSPVLLMADPAGGADLVVEQSGRIVRADLDHSVVLDISDDVQFGGEQGLLGLAFHPDFADNGLAYVNYVDRSRTTVIEEFTVVDGTFDVSSRRTVLTVPQPASNHNGGMIAFGPDGYLWIGMGDGGASDDKYQNGQDPFTLLGAMLRIDVDGGEGAPYGIPLDNPYADGADGAPEVWATGLRNPWRFSFDGDDVWIADVGQNDVEEVDVVKADVPGMNFGWPVMEGSTCFQASQCDASSFVAPVLEYRHDEGCSITGGYVYRGEAIPQIDGHYFYSDYCSGFLRSYTAETGVVDWTPATGAVAKVSGFGIGGDGELYVVSLGGALYRVESG